MHPGFGSSALILIKVTKVEGCAWLDAHQSPDRSHSQRISNRGEAFSLRFVWQLPGESERAQTWFRGRKAQLLYKMAWGTALNSSMPQNAPRLPPSEPNKRKAREDSISSKGGKQAPVRQILARAAGAAPLGCGFWSWMPLRLDYPRIRLCSHPDHLFLWERSLSSVPAEACIQRRCSSTRS